MAGAEDLALDAEIAAQPDTQAIGQHHQPRRDGFAVGQRELLPLRAGRDIGDLGVDEFGGGRDFGPDRADQRVVHDAVLAARLLVEQIAESRDPVFAVMGGRAQHRIGDSGLVEAIELLVAADFFDAEVERIDLMRIDQDGRNPRASEHGGRGRAGKAAADDRNVGVLHGESQPGCDTFAPGMANKGLAGRPALVRIPGNDVSGYIYPGKNGRLSWRTSRAAHYLFCTSRIHFRASRIHAKR